MFGSFKTFPKTIREFVVAEKFHSHFDTCNASWKLIDKIYMEKISLRR